MMKKNVNIGYLVFLSFVAALGGFLFGYDTAVISGTIAQVTVLFHFGYLAAGMVCGLCADRLYCGCTFCWRVER